MPGERTELIFAIRGENIEVLDQAGNKLGEIATKAGDGGAALAQLQVAAAEVTKTLQALGAATTQANTGVGGLAESSVKASQGLDQVRGKADGFGQSLGVGTQHLAGFSSATSDATTRLSGLGQGLGETGREATGALATIRGYIGGVTAAQVAVGGLAVGVGVAAYAMQASARENIRRVDELNNIATATGLTVRELSQLEYVARRNQVEVGALGGGFQALNRSIAEAANGAGRDARVFKALEIDVRDTNGSLRSGIDIYRDVADALKDLPPSVEKSSAAAVLFAGNHDAMLKVMKGGSAEFDRLIAQADSLGYTLDQHTTDSATRITDAFSRAGAAAYGFGISLGQPILAPLADAADGFADLVESANELARVDPGAFWERTTDALLDALPIVREAVALYRLAAGIGLDFLDVKGGGSTTAGADAPRGTDERRRRALADALGRPDRSGAGAQNRLEQLTDQSLLGAAQARATAAQTAVTLAEQDLTIFRERLELEGVFANTQGARVALLESAYQQELELARRVDEAKVRELDAQIAILEARKQDSDVVEAVSKGLTGQLDAINASQDALRVQRDLIEGSAGQAARVADEYARARAEIQAANRVVLNLGDTVNSSLQRATDGLFNRGTGGLKDVLADSGKALGSSLIGGFLEAELKKREFDAMVNENFTVTLPGFMEEGANQIKSIWGEAMDFMANNAQEAAGGIVRVLGGAFGDAGNSATSFGNTAAGVVRNLPSSNPYLDGGTIAQGLDGRYLVSNAFGETFSSSSSSAAIDAASGTPGLAAGAGIGALAPFATAAAVGYLGYSLTGAIGAQQRARQDISLRNIITDQDVRDESGIWGAGPIAAAVAVPLVGQFYALIAGLLEAAGIFDAPSQGTQLKIGLNRALPQGYPQQRRINIGGESGLRTQFIEGLPTEAYLAQAAALGFTPALEPGLRQTIERVPIARQRLLPGIIEGAARNPEVEALRFNEALGLAGVLAPRPGYAVAGANALVNNFLLGNVPVEEARRQLLRLAEKNGVTLESGLDVLTQRYRGGLDGGQGKGRFRDDPRTDEREDIKQYLAEVEGLTKLFGEDLPAGVDLGKLAIENFAEESGVNVAKFTDEMDRAIEIFGRLEATQEAGLRTGLDVAVDSLARRNQLLAGGGNINEIIRANLEARRGLVGSLYDAVNEGFSTALTDGLQDALQDSPAWKALTDRIAAAVNGAPLGDIPALINDLIDASLPQLEATAAAMAELRGRLGVTPTALFGSATAIREQIKDARFDLLNPRQQEASLKNELAVIDQQIAAIREGGITTEEQLALRPLLDRRAEIGFELAGNASQRYAPGSQAGRSAIEYGLSIAEETAKLFVLAGDAQQPLIDSNTANTSAIDRNTEAVDRNTAAQGGGGVGAPVGAGATIIVVDAGGAPVTGEAERRLVAFVNDMIAGGKLTAPARGRLREITGRR